MNENQPVLIAGAQHTYRDQDVGRSPLAALEQVARDALTEVPGLCQQLDLDAAVRKAAEKKAKSQETVPTAEERISLMSTDESLAAAEDVGAGHRLSEFRTFGLDDPGGAPEPAPKKEERIDPDSIFNLPKGGDDEDEEEKA